MRRRGLRGGAVLALLGSAAAVLTETLDTPIVVDGPWRFTAVTDRLIRIEYDAAKKFVDEPTMAFIRTAPKGSWTGLSFTGLSLTDDNSEEWSTLTTSRVSVRYKSGMPPGNGTVSVTSLENGTYSWSWGDDSSIGNLLGTARTLDGEVETLDLNCNNKVSGAYDNSEMHCTWGLVSRSGWAVVNDTGMPMWTKAWFAESRNTIDVSVFLHGLDFAGAIADFFFASGGANIPPRWALGTMFTRWFNYDSDSVEAMIDDFESRSMPLDAWVFDMNWHTYGPWGSFSWNKNSFPRLQGMLDWIRDRGLKVGANMHEHDGVSTKEDTYDAVCKALGCTPGQNIPFDLYNRTYAIAQEDIAIRPLESTAEKQGIDFSWIDYQQGERDRFEKTRIRNLNPTIVLNYLRYSDQARRGARRRAMILSRWGGLGSHRYPLGFSGDQRHTWRGLAFLPYFTSTSANVGYIYWSHDTVGGSGKDSSDYELSVRWVQTTAWSPVLRFHDKGQGTGGCASTAGCARIVPWDMPTPFFEAVRAAARERDQLLPYIYTACFFATHTGLALVRPMYYEDPADDALYGLYGQYLFGPDLVVSPITQPSGPDAAGFPQAMGAVRWSVYAPRSARGWVDVLNGDLYAGGEAVVGAYGIRDVPSLARQGAVVPRRPWPRGESSLGRAQRPLSAVEFRIMPARAFYTGGRLSGSGAAVDDDGVTIDYRLKKQALLISCAYNFSGRTFSIWVIGRGNFVGRPTKVSLTLSFPQLPPVVLPPHPHPGAPLWESRYDHQLLGSSITTRDVDLSIGTHIQVDLDEAYAPVLPNFVGVLGRIRRARYIKDALDDLNVNYGEHRTNLTSYVLAATAMEPRFAAELPALWEGVRAQVGALKDLKDERRRRFIAQMLSNGARRRDRAPPAEAEPELLKEYVIV